MEAQDLVVKTSREKEVIHVIMHALKEAMFPFRGGTVETFITDFGGLKVRVLSTSGDELFKIGVDQVILVDSWDIIMLGQEIFMVVRNIPRVKPEANIILGEN